MREARLRLRMLGVLIVASIGCLGSSQTVDELERIVHSEAISEISRAAGLALGQHYAEMKSEEELVDLVVSGRTPGIRLAAKTALYRLNDPMQALIDLSDEELRALATRGGTEDERLNAARAYYFKIRDDLTAEQLETEARTNDSAELALAAGESLAGFYSSFNPMDEAELMRQAVDGPSAGLRRAASLALATIFIETSTLTNEEIYAEIAKHTLWHPDLAEAYMRLLACRFRRLGDL